VGWPNESGELLPQFSVCHSKASAQTFFSRHVVDGAALATKNPGDGCLKNPKII
jgi:hypothetical protein